MGLKNSKKTYGFRQPRRKGAVLGMRSSSTDYFAYGSNMNIEHLREWLDRFGVPGDGVSNPRLAILPGFRLRTNYLTTTKKGAANIEPSRGQQVEGVLFTVSPDVVAALDLKEGHPRRYRQTKVEVIMPPSGRKITAMTYRVTEEHQLDFDMPVSEAYRNLVLSGAAEAGLSLAYQSRLKTILRIPVMGNDASSTGDAPD